MNLAIRAKHSKRCEQSKSDKSKCRCSCGGKYHGIAIKESEENGEETDTDA